MKTVIEMAREAEIYANNEYMRLRNEAICEEYLDVNWHEIRDERFAELVRADERAMLAKQPTPVQPGLLGRAQGLRDALELVLSWIDDWCETGPETGFGLIEEKANAALAEQPAPVQGWKLVPVEPTVAMVDATGAVEADMREMVVANWKAMLAAAPQAQPAQQEPLAWVGCGECDCSFPCTKGGAACIRSSEEPATYQLNGECHD